MSDDSGFRFNTDPIPGRQWLTVSPLPEFLLERMAQLEAGLNAGGDGRH